MKLTAQDWITLINLGVTSVGKILDARRTRKPELAAISPELAEMPLEQFQAVFAAYYSAEDHLAQSAIALVEAGAAEKGAGG